MPISPTAQGADIEGVSQVSIYGERQECINIELYEDRMAQPRHPPRRVLTLNGQNQTILPGGYERRDASPRNR